MHRISGRFLAVGVFLALTMSPAMVAQARDIVPSDSDADITITDPHEGQKLFRVNTVPYRTVVIEDDTLPFGVEVQDQAGADGIQNVYVDLSGPTFSIPTVTPETVVEPTDRVIRRGTMYELPVVSPPPAPEPEPEPEPVQDEQAANREATAPVSVGQYSVSDLMFMGVVNWDGIKFTYYSQQVLPGPGLSIPGRHVNSGGFVADADGYIVLAAPYGISHGTVYATPFGYSGKVYDTCATCSLSPLWLDVYTQ